MGGRTFVHDSPDVGHDVVLPLSKENQLEYTTGDNTFDVLVLRHRLTKSGKSGK
jgi:hypothetical protein